MIGIFNHFGLPLPAKSALKLFDAKRAMIGEVQVEKVQLERYTKETVGKVRMAD
jgi:hypothetical protein